MKLRHQGDKSTSKEGDLVLVGKPIAIMASAIRSWDIESLISEHVYDKMIYKFK